MKDLKLLQPIGKGEFGGEPERVGALGEADDGGREGPGNDPQLSCPRRDAR